MDSLLTLTFRRFLFLRSHGHSHSTLSLSSMIRHLSSSPPPPKSSSSSPPKSQEEEQESNSNYEDDNDFEHKAVDVRRRRKERQLKKISDLIKQPERTKEEEEKGKRRYEKDVPPIEEERHKYWKTNWLVTRSVKKELIRTDMFEEIKDKNKISFQGVVDIWKEKDVHLRGHVEFIYAALAQMAKFGVHRDLESYKKIIDIFPKGRMISTNMFQVEFMHYPKQQQCAVDVLEQMEHYGVCPDSEVQQMLTNIFGSQSFPMRKACRMLYWMPKFKNLSPWALPEPLPDDCLELCKLAIQRITSVDLSTKISVFNAEELEDASDPTWIVSGQSPDQQSLIDSLPQNQPIYVEGAFRVWLQRVCINYFILRAEPKETPKPPTPTDPDDVGTLHTIFGEDYRLHAVETVPSVHEQDDGVILGVCATGTSSKDSIVSWIKFLEKDNPRLGKDVPILFTLRSPIGPTDDVEVPSFEEAEQLKLLTGKQESPYSVSSGGKLGVDPRLPNLKQMGIWSESETVFPNWPHLHHPEDSPSAKNLKENLRLVDELEEHIVQKKLKEQKQEWLNEKKEREKDGPKHLT